MNLFLIATTRFITKEFEQYRQIQKTIQLMMTQLLTFFSFVLFFPNQNFLDLIYHFTKSIISFETTLHLCYCLSRVSISYDNFLASQFSSRYDQRYLCSNLSLIHYYRALVIFLININLTKKMCVTLHLFQFMLHIFSLS